MTTKFHPLSDSENSIMRSLRRAGSLPPKRKQLTFLIPVLLLGGSFLSTASANGMDSNLSPVGSTDGSGGQAYAVAVPRYIPQTLPNYQGTDPDLTVAKANDTGGNATVGVPFTWTLTVANSGTVDGTFADTQTILQDTLPEGPAYGDPIAGNFNGITNSGNISCSIVGDVLACTAGGADVTIGAGGSFTVTYIATPATPGDLVNTATVDFGNNILESNELNNTGTDTVTATLSAPDLTVAKANDTGGNATVGIPFTWTLTVANSGTVDGTFTDAQTILQDTLPAGPAYGDPIAGNFNSITNSGNISCSVVGDVLACTAGGADVTIGAGGSFTVTYTATPATPGDLVNTATVDPDSRVAESNEGNNTGTDTVTLPAPDLTVAKANDVGGNATVGIPFTWTLTVANSGTVDGTFTDAQTILQDTLPAGPAYGDPIAGNFNGITNSANISCSIVGDVLSCTAGGADVTIGASGSFTVTFSATPAVAGNLDNTATVDPDNNVVESNELNNTGSDTVSTTLPMPDLTVAKANDTGGNATVGVPFTWTLTVANGGTVDGTFADTQTILQDTLPAGSAYADLTAGNFNSITNSASISCSIVGDILACTAGGADVTIGAGGGFTVTFTATPYAPGQMENTAAVDPNNNVVESSELNNTGSNTVAATLPPAPSNDDFDDAISVSPLPYFEILPTWSASTHAEHDPEFSCIIGGPLQGQKSVWYSYTVTRYEAITIDTTGSNYNTVIGIWRGTKNHLIEVACSEQSLLTISLVPGTTYYIEVAQSGEDAGGSLHFSVSSAALHGLRADYFDNIALSGTPVLTRVDPLINFTWTARTPGPGVPSENYSVRWIGRVLPQYSEVYTFYTYSDDGVRLWVDDQLLIDQWGSHEAAEHTGAIALQAGTYYSIRLEYYQISLASVIRLQWSSDSVAKEVVPTTALDYLDVGNSTVLGDGAQPVADGVATSLITVTLIDSMGNRVSGIPVYLRASGSGNYVNNSAMEPNVWILIGYTDAEGHAYGLLASTSVGAKTIKTMAGGMSVGTDVIVTFVAGPVERISVSHISGQEGTEADSGSNYPSVSNDGTRAVFLSSATNLLPGDNTSNANIFILNTGTDVLSQAMFATENGQPNDIIEDPKISGNGQFIVFTSIAYNLSASCTNDSRSDIFVYEIAEGVPGTFTCISVGLGGAEGNAPSEHPAISDDGRYVVFASSATNLVSDVTDGLRHIYLYDRNTPGLTVVSRDSAEELANGDSDNPSISADGLSIVFESVATNLIGAGNDTNIASDIFLRDISGDGVTTRLSVTSAGEELAGSSTLPSISSNGNRVAFLSNASNLTPKEAGVRDVYLRDIPNTSTSLVSVDTSGGGANGSSNFARISSDGLHVIFASTATDLVPGVNTGIEQIYLRDLTVPETVKISHSADGTEGNNNSPAAGISSDGATIIFQSNASNLVAGDTLGHSDIFLTERVAPAVPPNNDDITAAISITPLPHSTIESTFLATRDIGDDPLLSCGGSPSQHYNSVWYTIQPSVNTRLDLSTAGSSYDTVMAVWSGAPGNLTGVACDDDSDGVQSAINFLAAGGTRYWIEVVQKGVIGGGTLVFNAHEVVPLPVYVYVFDFHRTPDVGLTVTAFDNETETGYSVVTNDTGEAMFNLPEGSYRFRVIKNGETYWSGETDHCIVPGCPDVEIMTDGPILVTVEDTAHAPEVGMEVRVFDSNGYAGYSGITDSNGQVEFTLPSGVNYNFRVVKGLSSFWSNPTPNCSLPTCIDATITTNIPITITILNGSGLPEADVWVHAFDGPTYTGISFKTDAEGKASFTLPDGSYHFRADKLGRGYWSETYDHCTIPSCADFTIYVYNSVTVHVEATNGTPDIGVLVRAFGDTNEYFAYTDSNGDAILQVPNDDYRFRATKNGTIFWSGEPPTCSVPTCSTDTIITNVPVTVTILNGAGLPEAGVWVHAYNQSAFTGLSFKTNALGQASFTLPDGSYRFRADKGNRAFWSNADNHCSVPGCTAYTFSVFSSVTIHVEDTNGTPDVGLLVRAFGDTNEYFAYTDSNGDATLHLPNDDYRFRATKNGTVFWSEEIPTCSVPTCSGDDIITNIPLIITVRNGSGLPEADVWVHAFNQSVFAGLSYKTDANGQVRFTLPDGEYRFRADKLERAYWSGTGNHCSIPDCTNFTMYVYNSVTVHVEDTNGAPDVGIAVHAFGDTSGIYAFTDSNGNATLQVPFGNWRFRVVKNDTPFWSGETPTCSVPSCSTDDIITNVPVIVTITNGFDLPEPDIWVHAYNQDIYAGLSYKTNAQGEVRFTLPNGSYRFRAEKLGRTYWSNASNHCTVPSLACTDVFFKVYNVVTVRVRDRLGVPDVGVVVRAFGDNSENYGLTDSNGEATLQVPNGHWRFRAIKNNSAFWSGETSTCFVPTCTSDTIITNVPVTITILNGAGLPEAGVWVHAFNQSAFLGLSYKTNALGQASFTLPDGSYRFRADKGNRAFWSNADNHCTVPACTAFTFSVPSSVTVHVEDRLGNVDAGIYVRAFGDTNEYFAYTDSNGDATLHLPNDDYRFRAIKGNTPFWSGGTPTCSVPTCTTDSITTNVPVTVTILNGAGLPEADVWVHAFNQSVFAGLSYKTDANGQARFTLPDGEYRFRADKGNRAFWSNANNHCTVPVCTAVTFSVSSSVTVHVEDTGGAPEVGIAVRAFGDTSEYYAFTDSNGNATLPLPNDEYRFRAIKNNAAFWSGPIPTCSVPTCSADDIITNVPVIVTVRNASGDPEANLYVHAFTGTTFAGLSIRTNALGQASFTLPNGNFRFRADKGNSGYWSGPGNHCTMPGNCAATIITTGGGVSAVNAGLGWSTCAILPSGALKCWGLNPFGNLGDGTTSTRSSPTNVIGLATGVIGVSVGSDHTCALMAGGTVKCWGNNEYGGLGDGTTTNQLSPVNVVGLPGGITAIAAGGGYTCALTSSGGVKCWGLNTTGQLGDGTCNNYSTTPVDVVGLTSGVVSFSAGATHTCAVTTGGGVKCWGAGNNGLLGNGSSGNVCSPVNPVGLASNVTAISVGAEHTCALTTGGGVKCWGMNGDGRLGDGSYDFKLTPSDVFGLASGITKIAAGAQNTCAITTAGGLKCWGENIYCQLHDGICDTENIPVSRAEFTSGIKAVTVGENVIYVITTKNILSGWGRNEWGQIGGGTIGTKFYPIFLYL
jgi:alpha-tubulin suppressor-like RCC1 family protein